MSCASCSDLTLVWPIRSPGELRTAVGIVRQNLDDGTILEVATATGSHFVDLSPTGPWDDVFQFRFLCPRCGQTFSLAAETYHGGGGEWRPDEREDSRS